MKEYLQQRIQHKIMEINNNLMMLENVMRNFDHRGVKCIDEGGQHFQHLL
jgi:hypothetical protein